MSPWSMRQSGCLLAGIAGGLLALGARADAPYEGPPIDYLKAPVHDPVAKLQERIDQGQFTLDYEPRHGYLPAVLRALDVPIASQVLVFSKTSFQLQRISPQTPRALYFNDRVYVGWVPDGDVIELSSMDPQQGPIYYTLAQQKAERPRVQRHTHECLTCHSSSRTEDVPGHLLRSVFPRRDGSPMFNAGTYSISHESPLEKRWGGWYVTGKHGDIRHMGNCFIQNLDQPEVLDRNSGANLTDLGKWFDTSAYLSSQSDIVALMVLEHQTRMQNLITKAGFEGRMALHYDAEMNKAFGRPAAYRSESTQRRIGSAVDALLEYMLLINEAPLESPIAGDEQFVKALVAAGPRDPQGRSLRDLDCQKRLFKFPCSYLIYSPAFDGLPDEVRLHALRRLCEILLVGDKSGKFARLTEADRRANYEIVQATKPKLPDDWKAPFSAAR